MLLAVVAGRVGCLRAAAGRRSDRRPADRRWAAYSLNKQRRQPVLLLSPWQNRQRYARYRRDMASGKKAHIALADMTLLAPAATEGGYSASVIFLGHKYEADAGQPFRTPEEAEGAAERLARKVLLEVFDSVLTHIKWGEEDEA